MSRQEGELIREYWSQHNPQPRFVVIREHARLMHMSDSRAEDALHLWAHVLSAQRGARSM